jgi:predicted cupin superfamily sugar epimerase
MTTAAEIRQRLRMQPIPGEGGWFAPGPRIQELSSVTVLLSSEEGGFSAMHRLAVNEGWQWLDGAPVALLRLRPAGTGVLNVLDERTRQILVRRGTWQGAIAMGEWSLVSCWCSPAFRDSHFTLGDRASLVADYPRWQHEIELLTRPS